MSKSAANPPAAGGASERSFFEQEKEALMHDISQEMENVLENLNRLNRSLEGIISVGNEFSSVEALWSLFENVMAKDTTRETPETAEQDAQSEDQAQRSVS